MPSYRMKCRNAKCGGEFLRYYPVEEFEKGQYSSCGWACFNCGFPKMAVIKSKKSADDRFKPGWQKNIGKYCATEKEYKQLLKDMKLVEIGYEELPEPEEDGTQKYWTDDIIKKIHDTVGGLDGELVRAMKKGEI